LIKLTLANAASIKFACLNYHYAKRVPIVAIAFNVYEDNEYCGVICYGFGASVNIASSMNRIAGQVIELVRVALNGKQKTTSECLAASIREIKKRCPMVDYIVSFADCDQDHKGIIYQATNWFYLGLKEEDQVSGIVINGKSYHRKSVYSKYKTSSLDWIKKNVDRNAYNEITKGKQKYVMPMNKKSRKEIQHLHLPYPK
jgi:hypothetical protein